MALIESSFCPKSPDKKHHLSQEVVMGQTSYTGFETDSEGNPLSGGRLLKYTLVTYASTCIYCDGVKERTVEKQ